MNSVKITIKDLYTFLITYLRYAYTRNNHLEPSSAYSDTERLIYEMYKVDRDYALHTVKQIAEECISQELMWNFADGEDDEYNNRLESIKFVNWCLDFLTSNHSDSMPYNLDDFKQHLELDKERNYYSVYEVVKYNKHQLIADELCLEDAKQFIFEKVCDDKECATYRKERVTSKKSKHANFIYRILYPVKKTFIIKRR